MRVLILMGSMGNHMHDFIQVNMLQPLFGVFGLLEPAQGSAWVLRTSNQVLGYVL